LADGSRRPVFFLITRRIEIIMWYRPIAAVALVGLIGSTATAAETTLKDDQDRESYSVGYQIGSNFKRQGIELKSEPFSKGMQDALSGSASALSKEDIEKALASLQQRAGAAQQKLQKETSDNNLSAGKAFMDENGKKEGVVTLPSGLQYKILTEGNGAKPKPTDTVTVNYRGTLIDGTEFDSSYKRGQPASFRLDQVVKGWTEGLQLLKQGSKAQLVIPPALGYGERGAGPIAANSTLVFEVELVGIEAPGKASDGTAAKKDKGGKKK
jgi:FKBP-type peptidyl-prolyl cis-trans isomerase FklB